MIVDDPLAAFFEGCGSEIDQKAYRQMQQSQIGEHLFRVNGRECLDGFELHHQTIVHQQVDPKTLIKNHVMVLKNDRFLPFYLQSLLSK